MMTGFRSITDRFVPTTKVSELLMKDIKTDIKYILAFNNVDIRTVVDVSAEFTPDKTLKITIQTCFPSTVIGVGGNIAKAISGFIRKNHGHTTLVDVKEYNMWETK